MRSEAGEQANQGIERRGSLRRAQFANSLKQSSDVVLRIQIWRRALVAAPKQLGCWNLGGGVEGLQIACKAAHDSSRVTHQAGCAPGGRIAHSSARSHVTVEMSEEEERQLRADFAEMLRG